MLWFGKGDIKIYGRAGNYQGSGNMGELERQEYFESKKKRKYKGKYKKRIRFREIKGVQ
jgi:hypothetical protein